MIKQIRQRLRAGKQAQAPDSAPEPTDDVPTDAVHPAAPARAVADWFAFDHEHGDRADLKSLLGGKGAGLVDMSALGIPVPPGFTIPTTVCVSFLESGWTDAMAGAVRAGVQNLEMAMGRTLGSDTQPLLVSVRSGAAISMPGMMDTVLNAGMTADVARGLAAATGDSDFAWDTYRRAVVSYAQVVLGADPSLLAELDDGGGDAGDDGTGASAEDRALAFSAAVAAAGFEIPSAPLDQITEAVKAVFQSWHADRAYAYRERQGIDHGIGTAANVQAMVFGNRGDTSGTGVAFSRDPSTGEPGLNGDFLVGAQGEDVVAGTHKTMPLSELSNLWPSLWSELTQVSDTLEQHSQDMVDLEFTIEDGTLWLLQTRVAKRSPRAAFRAAVDMAEDSAFASVDRGLAIERCAEYLDDPPMLSNTSAATDDAIVLGSGLAASPGLAVGVLSLDPDDAVTRQEQGERVILAREETSPNDVHGMGASVGLITTLGGMVSHAAVVARAWGLAAVVGCSDLSFADGALIAGDHTVSPGTVVSVCGDTGTVYLGEKSGARTPLPEVEQIQSWVRERYSVADAASTGAAIDADECLRLVALKGMTTAESLTEPLAADAHSIESCLKALTEQGVVEELKGGRVRTTEQGKAAVADLLRADQQVAQSICDDALHPFHAPNSALKEVVTAWQVRMVDGEQQPNDHNDRAYDEAVLSRLVTDVHEPIGPILEPVTQVLPRLARYQTRLDTAIDKLNQGDGRYLAHPLLDSYHTAWFELHEELIQIGGRDRKTETEAGRA